MRLDWCLLAYAGWSNVVVIRDAVMARLMKVMDLTVCNLWSKYLLFIAVDSRINKWRGCDLSAIKLAGFFLGIC